MLSEELWTNIPGFNGKYQAHPDGRIRRVYGSGKTRQMTGTLKYPKKGSGYRYVKLFRDGKQNDVKIQKAIWMTFRGDIPKGMCIIHKNRNINNNSLKNLKLVTRDYLGIVYGGMSNNVDHIVKVDMDFNPVDIYPNMRRAGKANFMSGETIRERCRGSVKKAPAPDGFEYYFEDDNISMKKCIERINRYRERRGMPALRMAD